MGGPLNKQHVFLDDVFMGKVVYCPIQKEPTIMPKTITYVEYPDEEIATYTVVYIGKATSVAEYNVKP